MFLTYDCAFSKWWVYLGEVKRKTEKFYPENIPPIGENDDTSFGIHKQTRKPGGY